MAYKFKINSKTYSHPNQLITGSEIKTYGNIPLTHVVFQKVDGWEQDKKINHNSQVDLSESIQSFYSTPIDIING